MHFLNVSAILACNLLLVCCKKYERKDGKLLLDPIELIDLITEEKLKTGLPLVPQNIDRLSEETMNNVLDLELIEGTTEECRDEETLRARKVWSRWSKWGECSVTCGAGAISRQRACVAGRCARGEREVQQRPCLRAPCLQAHAEDLRDVD